MTAWQIDEGRCAPRLLIILGRVTPKHPIRIVPSVPERHHSPALHDEIAAIACQRNLEHHNRGR